jgi:hypothetical protein
VTILRHVSGQYFERDVAVLLSVPSKPDSSESPEPQFMDCHVLAALERIADDHRMEAAFIVPRKVLACGGKWQIVWVHWEESLSEGFSAGEGKKEVCGL